jgi:hypothetical protein
MPPIHEIFDPLTTTSDPIQDAIIQDVMKPITSALIKDNPHWTSYGMFFFGLLWMGNKFGPRIFYYCMKKATEWQNKIKKKPQLSESQMEMADVLA